MAQGAYNLTASNPTDKAGAENPGSDPRTVAELDAYFERSKQHKRLIAHEVILNVAFYAGDQDAIWESVAGRLRRVNLPWQSSLFHNLVKSNVVAFVAKMLANKPGWQVAPGSSDDEDVAAAMGAEHLLDYYYRKGGLQGVVQDAMIQACLGTISWIKVVWDWSKGRNLDTLQGPWMYGPGKSPDNTALGGANGTGVGFGTLDPMGGEVPKPSFTSGGEYSAGSGSTGELKEGDLSFSVVDFFMGFPDPNQLRPDEPAQRFMEVHRLTRRECQARWPDRAQYIQATPVVADDQFGTVYQSAVFEGVLGYGSPAEQGRDSANEIIMVKEYCELPSPAHPDGRFVQYAHNTVLYDGPLPGKRVHYFPIWAVKHPRRFWPVALATEIRTINHSYNQRIRQTEEYTELMMKGAWLNPVGSGVPKESFIARHGLILNYRPVGFNKPEQIPLRPFPDIDNHLNRLVGDCQDAMSIREITKGYAPPNVGAASAIAMLQEQDQTASAPIQNDLLKQLVKIGEHALELIHENMQFPRQIELLGEAGEWQVLEFNASNVQPWHVYIEASSMLPKSKYAAVQTFKDLWQMGIIIDEKGQPDFKMAGRILQGEFFRPEVFRADRVAEEIAKRENTMAKQGFPLSTMPEENHDLHVRLHTQQLMALKFKLDPQSIAASLALRAHIREHLMALLAAQSPAPPAFPPPPSTGGPGGSPMGPPFPGGAEASAGGRFGAASPAGPPRPPPPGATPPAMNPSMPRGAIEPVMAATAMAQRMGGLGGIGR